MIIRKLSKRLIEAEFAQGSRKGERFFIPRVTLSPSEDLYPFTLRRRQFPIRVAFCMTINKSQGQTLSCVGVFLPQPVFTHGQLYVALSPVGSADDVSVFLEQDGVRGHGYIASEDAVFTRNVVFHEVLA